MAGMTEARGNATCARSDRVFEYNSYDQMSELVLVTKYEVELVLVTKYVVELVLNSWIDSIPQVPFQQRATLEAHRRRCSAKPTTTTTNPKTATPVSASASVSASVSAIASAANSASSPTLAPPAELPALPLQSLLGSNSSEPETPPTLVKKTNLVPRKLNLHPNAPNALPSEPTLGEEIVRQHVQTGNSALTRNPMHFLGNFKYLASKNVFSSSHSIDPNKLSLPKTELC